MISSLEVRCFHILFKLVLRKVSQGQQPISVDSCCPTNRKQNYRTWNLHPGKGYFCFLCHSFRSLVRGERVEGSSKRSPVGSHICFLNCVVIGTSLSTPTLWWQSVGQSLGFPPPWAEAWMCLEAAYSCLTPPGWEACDSWKGDMWNFLTAHFPSLKHGWISLCFCYTIL